MGKQFLTSLWLLVSILSGCGDDNSGSGGNDSDGNESGSGPCDAVCRQLDTVCYAPAGLPMDHPRCQSDCATDFDAAMRVCINEAASCEAIDACFAPPDGGCTPQCGSKECGDDGCGQSCGTCPSGETCNAMGQCTGAACISEDSTDCYDGTCCDGLICRERTGISGNFICCIPEGDSCDRPDVAAGTINCCGQYDGWGVCANDGEGGLVCKTTY
jgi:hypothetical protein